MVTTTNGLGQKTSEDNAYQLNECNANSNASKYTSLVFYLFCKFGYAANSPKSLICVGTQDHIKTAADCILFAAAIWNIYSMAEGCVGPVCVILNTTAMNLYDSFNQGNQIRK